MLLPSESDVSFTGPGVAGRTSPDTQPVASGTQAVDRALSVLLCFGRGAQELGISDIARTLELNTSTVHRIVRALTARGFLEQNFNSGRYRLGRTVVVLGQTALAVSGIDRARHVLERVGQSTGESVNLGVRDGGAVLVLAKVASPHPLRFDHEPGQRVALHATAMGKVLLAFDETPSLAVARLAVRQLQRFTPSTMIDADELQSEIERIAMRGFATDEEESIQGVRCVGAPVLDFAGIARAAIAVQAPKARLSLAAAEELGPELMHAAEEVAQAMGIRGGRGKDCEGTAG